MIEEYYNNSQGIPSELPIKIPIDFSKYYDYNVPVFANKDKYEIVMDMTTVSQLHEFAYPKRALLDYIHRTGLMISGMNILETRAVSTLEFMKKCYPGDQDLYFYEGATWWTQIPIPFRNEHLAKLSDISPNYHLQALMAIVSGSSPGNTLPRLTISVEDVQRLAQENPERWKGLLSADRKTATSKKNESTEYSDLEEFNTPNLLLALPGDDIRQVMEEFSARVHETPEENSTVEEVFTFNPDDYGLPAGHDDWVPNDDQSDADSYVYDPEAEESDSEFLAQYLDQVGTPGIGEDSDVD